MERTLQILWHSEVFQILVSVALGVSRVNPMVFSCQKTEMNTFTLGIPETVVCSVLWVKSSECVHAPVQI